VPRNGLQGAVQQRARDNVVEPGHHLRARVEKRSGQVRLGGSGASSPRVLLCLPGAHDCKLQALRAEAALVLLVLELGRLGPLLAADCPVAASVLCPTGAGVEEARTAA